MRRTIEIRGARENNLQNVSLELPRDQLVVVTGVSGSGKSSLAFDTLYAEGQRRLMASMSTYAKRFAGQMKKPDVDFVNGLSPVISIDQKTVGSNPRSTVGTMTDVWDYIRMLYASVGIPHCPRCDECLAPKSPAQMMEHMLALPVGTLVEVRAPVSKVFGEDYEYLFEQIRVNGYRHARIDGKEVDLGNDIELEEDAHHTIDAVVDQFVIEKGIDKQVVASLTHGLELGDGMLSFHITSKYPKTKQVAWQAGFGCKKHGIVAGTMQHFNFSFNLPTGACVTCAGIGTSMRVHAPLLTPDTSRTLNDGVIIKEAMKCDKNTWGGRMLYSLAQEFKFSLDQPWDKLSQKAKNIILNGTNGKKFKVKLAPGTRQGKQQEGREISYRGLINQIEHNYHWYRKQGSSNDWTDSYLKKVMVEYDCPECQATRLKKTRRSVTINGKGIHELGEMHLVELQRFLKTVKPNAGQKSVTDIIRREIDGRLELLISIGLDYLSLNRTSGTLSGGESQRIRLSSQIGSGLMGMLYVLDEPSIGLHPKDNVKMIETLRRLQNLGNTVIVVEHDEDTIRAADHIIEVGPGPGIHGGHIVEQGPLKKILANRKSPTGQYLSGAKTIPIPAQRRAGSGESLSIKGARHNNLKNVNVDIPLGKLVSITGASGSGKSSLVHQVLYKRLYALKQDSRVLAGAHDELLGHQHVDDIISIDQSPIGRSPRSNPATYVGFYDHIRKLFAGTQDSKIRKFTASQFSFNVKGGRCEECSGDGTIVTKLSFMPDVEVTCPTCKGDRYKQATLDVLYNGKNIAEVLNLSVEEGVKFFADQNAISRRLQMLNELGLGYITIGHPSTLLSGGEAQRVKLATELSKLKRGKHNLYILDEPTTGLHFADIDRLLDSLNRLVDRGHTVLVIEHNLDVIKTSDHVIDLGPEGGHKGGKVMAHGTPEKVARSKKSHTAKFLRDVLS